MKKYLGIIFIIYSSLIGYVIYTNKLNNFLAPSMQIYIKLSILPMLIIGIIILFNKNFNYSFKMSDLVLLLPIFMFMLIGNGNLTASFASNRMMNVNKTKDEIIESKTNENQETIEEDDFSNPYFNIIDENYDALSNYISYEPKAKKYEGKTIKVKGFALKYASYIPEGYFTIGRYSISCCVADATFTGFFIKYDTNKIKTGSWYEIEGILKPGKDHDGYNIMYIEVVNLKEIDNKNEEQYIYPCYAYGNGSCSEVTKYDLEH